MDRERKAGAVMRGNDEIMATAQRVEDAAMRAIQRFEPMWPDAPVIRDALLWWVSDAFAWFTERDPAVLDSMLASLQHVRSGLADPVSEKMDTIKHEIGDWTGTGAQNFQQRLVEPFPEINDNQQILVERLYGSLDAIRTLLVQSREDIVKLGNGFAGRLDNLEEPSKWQAVLGVLGAALGVLAAIPSGGTLGFAVAAGVVNATSALTDDTSSGATPEDVLGLLAKSIGALRQDMATTEATIAEVLRMDAAVVVQDLNGVGADQNSHCKVGRPAIMDGQLRGEFNPPA